MAGINNNLSELINNNLFFQCANYNTSLITFIITNLSATNASLSVANVMTLTSSVDWYGLDMNAGTIYCNTETSAKHSVQVAGTEYAYINSNGTITGNVSTTNIHVDGLHLNDLETICS